MCKKVWQRGDEWGMLYCMAYTIMQHSDYNHVVDTQSHQVLGDALERIYRTKTIGSTYIIFSQAEMDVLLRIVNWYDDMMVEVAEVASKINPQFFESAYMMCGKVKRNLVLYATLYEAA
ncbi:hypothetical protein [Runella limosa]|uniref:hypothetical protein n=1 Tax=Runella limosa TaxID=370978 RepID=UPI0003F68B03|nr:hypothetical protein [Runella limosa]